MLNTAKTLFQRFAARRIFTKWAPDYDDDVRANRYSAATAIRGALKPYLRADSHILDIGIGTGMIWDGLEIPAGVEISGIDISPDMLAQASSHPDIGRLYLCDAGRKQWPCEDGGLDMAVSAGLFEYLTLPMAQHVFAEAHRALKPGGLFIATYIPSEKNETKFWHGKSGRILSCRYTPEWMKNRSGFTAIHHTPAFTGSLFADGSTYAYRLIVLKRD